MTAPTVHLTVGARDGEHPGGGPRPGGVDADATALAALAERLGLTVEREILDGGSAARVYLARDEHGDRLAVKVLVHRPGLVDGHDVDSLLAKLTQLNWIRGGDRELAERYLPVRHAARGPGWAAYTTPFYPSVDSAAPLRGPGGVDAFFSHHGRVVRTLIVNGYGQAIVAAPPGYLDGVLAGRPARRAALLQRGLPAGLSLADDLVVNGVRCEAPLRLLGRLAETAPSWWRRLTPPELMFPAHGDANTRNILLGEKDDFRIIDPRGSTANADPIYDLAKTLFSLTVWDPALRLGCRARPVGGGPGHWEVGLRHPLYPGYRLAAHAFLGHLDGLPHLTALMGRDPHWRERLVLSHDLHVLSEAACRLSDPKIRVGPDNEVCTPADLALGHYLFGTLLLNDSVRRLAAGDLDVERHLSLVTGASAPAAGQFTGGPRSSAPPI